MKIELRNGTTGPSHDPYSAEMLIVRRDDGSTVRHYSNGLGAIEVMVGGSVVYESTHGDDRLVRLKAALLFKRAAGITPADAAAAYWAGYIDDPMGSPSSCA